MQRIYRKTGLFRSRGEDDRTAKLPLYAEAGVREIWIVALEKRVVEVHREPVDGEYRSRLELRPGDTVAPLALPDLEVEASYLLG